MELSSVVPWGRSLDEYQSMFGLTVADLGKSILGCCDGPASFNAEWTRKGGSVISVDPIYQFKPDQIRQRIDEVYDQIVDQSNRNQADFVWNHVPDIKTLAEVRMRAMKMFLDDFSNSQSSDQYQAAALPNLPFDDDLFDLALCSHYLFLYSEHVDQAQHIMSMKALCRVAQEVRVYPLLTIENNEVSPHLDAVIECLQEMELTVTRVDVEYEFQKGAKQMLVVKS